jgi:myo-inositol-1(or 4)-monophosphatase
MTREPRDDTALIVGAVREAGAIARAYFGGTYKSWNKGTGGPVTEADIAVDEFLKRSLIGARSDYGWLSEESTDDPARLRASRVFVVDPIDGTYGFVRGRPQFTVVAAVVAEGRPVSAAIYNPMTEEMYEATAGGGARLNGRAIHVSVKAEFDGAKLLASRSLIERGRWTMPWPRSLVVNTRASIAYRMALVAAGEYDAMISLSAKSDWDVAAADLIVGEAGGVVTTDRDEPLVYNRPVPEQRSVVCAGPALHAKLLARLEELEAPE